MNECIWINVNKKLPQSDTLVLVCFCGIVSYGKLIESNRWIVNDEPDVSMIKTDIISFVTHWMPFPKTPKGASR